jgi:hypothetical protein
MNRIITFLSRALSYKSAIAIVIAFLYPVVMLLDIIDNSSIFLLYALSEIALFAFIVISAIRNIGGRTLTYVMRVDSLIAIVIIVNEWIALYIVMFAYAQLVPSCESVSGGDDKFSLCLHRSVGDLSYYILKDNTSSGPAAVRDYALSMWASEIESNAKLSSLVSCYRGSVIRLTQEKYFITVNCGA